MKSATTAVAASVLFLFSSIYWIAVFLFKGKNWTKKIQESNEKENGGFLSDIFHFYLGMLS